MRNKWRQRKVSVKVYNNLYINYTVRIKKSQTNNKNRKTNDAG